MKKYGSDNTHLRLSDKAQKAYYETDPLDIYEDWHYDEDDNKVYTYSFGGVYDNKDLTEDEVNDILECLCDESYRYLIVNASGYTFDLSDWDAIVALMDDEIRESIAADLAPCSEQEFFTAYEKAHEAKYGEPWELSKANPQW